MALKLRIVELEKAVANARPSSGNPGISEDWKLRCQTLQRRVEELTNTLIDERRQHAAAMRTVNEELDAARHELCVETAKTNQVAQELEQLQTTKAYEGQSLDHPLTAEATCQTSWTCHSSSDDLLTCHLEACVANRAQVAALSSRLATVTAMFCKKP
jgi:mRNA-degrading endonuclease YafQ of YafQ-DinJ toxin-antitoxin module